MRRGFCPRHRAQKGPCSCGLGRMSRLVEPVILSLLDRGEARYGYEIMEQANRRALTDSEIDAAVVYRTLRTLESAGCVVSEWQPGAGGPHRRMYEITDVGRQHLQDWLTVLERHGQRLRDFVGQMKTA
jgi:PadR family transcriptional regulator PadR